MPELPEVEVFRRFAEQHALNRTIQSVQIFHPKILEKLSASALQSAVQGQRFIQAARHGKLLFLQLDSVPSRWVFMHFGLTGYLSRFQGDATDIVTAYNEPEGKGGHIRVQFDFEDGSHLAFHEQRMFGKLGLTDDPAASIAQRKMGPDALAVDADTFAGLLSKRAGRLKPVLMDQGVIAGIGNVYADEMLFQCKLHPCLPLARLSKRDIRCLFEQMEDILQKTVAADADRSQLPKSYLLHARTKKGTCPRDGTSLQIETIGGRTTHFCPTCQTV